jgi:hypothetical protein
MIIIGAFLLGIGAGIWISQLIDKHKKVTVYDNRLEFQAKIDDYGT